jgi:hypothetical protein
MRSSAWAIVAGLALAGCDGGPPTSERPAAARAETSASPPTAAEPALSGFVREGDVDASGYYMPVGTPPTVGTLRLAHLSVGAPFEFDEWRKPGPAAQATYAPIMLQFDDVASPRVTNELGAEAHTVQVRVLPTAFKLTADRLQMTGRDARLGAVSFTGALDTAKVAAERAEGLSSNEPVLRGTLIVGERRFENVAFTWFGGD